MRKPLVAALVAAAAAAAIQPALSAPAPRPAFTSYSPPGSMGLRAGEPTLGVNHETGAVMYQAGLETLRVTFSGRSATWTDVSPLIPSLNTLDPILETDTSTGRHFVSHLDAACSRMAFSDDDGATWTNSAVGCAPGALFDHQSVGYGPFKQGGTLRPLGGLYPNAVYYCSHDGFRASCGTSLDGGLTFGPGVLAYANGTCNTNFGHLKSAPDGTVYLPPTSCGGRAGVAVSEDNGLSWRTAIVPDSTTGNSNHPSVGVGSDGTAYLAWGGKDGLPYASVSTDRGRDWSEPNRLGREFGIRNTKFVTTVAGDGDRAAVAFLGTRTAGNDQLSTFDGVWHLYVSYTYDRGRTWTTVNATPGDPVQVGSICTSGILCTGGTRNLLDFNDVTIDRQGKVLAAFADGCLEQPCTTKDRARRATIARQTSGKGLLRAFDGR